MKVKVRVSYNLVDVRFVIQEIERYCDGAIKHNECLAFDNPAFQRSRLLQLYVTELMDLSL